MRNMYVLILAMVVLMATIGLAKTHIPGGFVSGIWDLAGSPYRLTI